LRWWLRVRAEFCFVRSQQNDYLQHYACEYHENDGTALRGVGHGTVGVRQIECYPGRAAYTEIVLVLGSTGLERIRLVVSLPKHWTGSRCAYMAAW
jgi:hypothetical protein